MYCPACGAFNNDRAIQCEECGMDFSPNFGEMEMHREPIQIPNYLVQSILVTICCCMPFGIVAIVFAAQVNGLIERGDYAAAQDKSRLANRWCWISFGTGLAIAVLSMLFQMIGAMVSIN